MPSAKQKNALPKSPNTIDGTPPSTSSDVRIQRASFDFPVWSSARKIAVPTPSGMVASMQTPIINRVDTIIGAMPPDLPESVGCSVRNVQFTCANPAVTTEYSSRQAAEQTTNAHVQANAAERIFENVFNFWFKFTTSFRLTCRVLRSGKHIGGKHQNSHDQQPD